MAWKVYTGRNGKITLDAITKRFVSIRIRLNKSKFEAPSSDADVMERGTALKDANMEIRFRDSDDSGGGTFKSISDVWDSDTAPSALSFTDNAGTPASRLPTWFFTRFPLSGWRIDDVETEGGGPGDPSVTVVTLTPGNLN